MNTPIPPEASHFSEEQRHILGQVYRLILSWRRERLARIAESTTRTESTNQIKEAAREECAPSKKTRD